MGTRHASSISGALFGKVRSSLLALLFCRSDEAFYFREILRLTGLGQGALQRELAHLAESGLVIRSKRGNQVYYQANKNSAVFDEIRFLMIKTAGVAEVVQRALKPVRGQVRAAFIYGSMAKGTEKVGSDIDIVIVGNIPFGEVVDALEPAQTALGREINPTVYSAAEFASRLSQGHHFLKSVVREPKIFLIGDEHELERLAGQRLAD
jgi:uncharacterized protein